MESFLLSVNHGIRVTKVLSKKPSTSCITTKTSDPFCLVCETEPSKYCCPKCSTPYCSLVCYRSHNNSCTESFFQGLVSQELEFQRQDKDERSNQGNILSILNRIQTQEIDKDNDVNDENTNNTDFSEQDLKRIYSALECNDEELLSKYFSPTIQTAFERDVQAGRLSQKDVGEWIPWWRSVLDSEHQADDQLNNSNMPTFTTTLDERLLAIPSLSKLRITSSSSPSSSSSSPDWPSPNLGYNLISILWSVIETLEWYGGPEKACCLEGAETFHYICPVISKDARYETVSHLVMERLSYPPKQNGKFTFYNDIIIILENPRHVAHLLLDGIDIIQQGAIDWFSASSSAKRNNKETPLLDKKERLKWKKVKMKLEYYLSWARDRNKSYWTYLIQDMEVWKNNSLITT
jgi:HIT zinc finger